MPGDIKSKLNPYMEPLWDNLKFIQNQYSEKDKEFKKITEAIESEKLVITAAGLHPRAEAFQMFALLSMKPRTSRRTK